MGSSPHLGMSTHGGHGKVKLGRATEHCVIRHSFLFQALSNEDLRLSGNPHPWKQLQSTVNTTKQSVTQSSWGPICSCICQGPWLLFWTQTSCMKHSLWMPCSTAERAISGKPLLIDLYFTALLLLLCHPSGQLISIRVSYGSLETNNPFL